MSYEFVQVSARNTEGDFALASNLSLMEYLHMTPDEAIAELERMTTDYSRKGFTVEWSREPLSAYDLEFYGDLFEPVEA